jgi:DNA topoisomerase I
MEKNLIIVESPAKIKTLKKFLGAKYSFASSVGHIRDLPEKGFGIDVEHDFEPQYEVLPDKKDVVKKLKDEAKKAKHVYLAPDPDREGEAIAWHISALLPKNTDIKRITFHSITKTEVLDALTKPRNIDLSLVNAQQARRLLDRIVGYKISPILTRKVRRGRSGSSAGRVQSVALKLVVDREKEIDAFIPTEYWNIRAFFRLTEDEKPFEAYLYSVSGKKVEKEAKEKGDYFLIDNEEKATQITEKIKDSSFTVAKVEKKEKKRHPVPPFITSTLQQEASRHFGFNPARTMSIAQSLYEGIDLGSEGTEGLITYMRTDSVQAAPTAVSQARDYIKKTYGDDYLPAKAKIYSSKKSAQEAHEAIRPTNLSHPPEMVKSHLTTDQYKLYLLIYRRFIASQMESAIYDTVSMQIATNHDMELRATGSTLKFPGFLAVYEEKIDLGQEKEKDGSIPPDIKEDMSLLLSNVTCAQSFTKPPPRFSEASLVKELEKSGIGRPSTYATIMNKIQSREYTSKEGQALKPTELGKVIAQLLEDNFKMIMDVNFTASMEDELEKVAEDKMQWKQLIRSFWKDFIPLVEKAEKEAIVPRIETDIKCPKCGHTLQKIWSRNKYFYGCSHYPDCDYTAAVESLTFNKEDYADNFNWDQQCPQCDAPMVIRHGRYGAFLGCSRYPDCNGIVNIPKKGEKIYDPKTMPSCPAVGCDGTIVQRRSRFGKTFFSCSNFPDCDVIVNELDDLPIKYADHPKTAYVKKSRKKAAKKSTKTAGKKKTEKKSSKKTTTKRKTKTLSLSPELQEILQVKEASRGDVLKGLWDYIKANNLQDPKNKRTIVPDQKLSQIIGKEPIDMMKLAGCLKNHMK